jgi:hypothetical protein
LGFDNALIGIAITALVIQQRVGRLAERMPRKDADLAIEEMLTAAVEGLAFPESIDNRPIRAFCHRAEKRTAMLVPVCRDHHHHYPDEAMPIPYEEQRSKGIVIAEVFRLGGFKTKQLPAKRSEVERDLHIWGDIRTVLAASISSADDANERIGTISFDSSLLEREVHFKSQRAIDIACTTAHAVALLWRE